MIDKTIQSGWYLLNGEKAYCRVSRDSDLISISYANGSFTAASIDTFCKWNAQPFSSDNGTKP